MFIVDRAGKEPLLGCISVDSTGRRRSEEERLAFERRMQQTQKLESLGVLAGGIAHDFNNLLMGILGNADLALSKSPPESPVRAYIRNIDTAAQRAADLANQMLAYSGKGRFVVEPIDLSRLVEEMGHLLATVISKRAALRYRLAADLPPVEADATQLRQVVMNLITNASDALGDEEGVITVATGVVEIDPAGTAPRSSGAPLPPGTYVFIEVSDTGCGMDPATRARIFDPFFTTKQTGRGLGLAAVLGIVRGHRGALRVSSEPGQGTTFTVLFPALPAQAGGRRRRRRQPAAAPGPAGAPADHPARGRRGARARDDADDARGERLRGGHGRRRRGGGGGVSATRPRELSAVVLDMNMPRMDGAGPSGRSTASPPPCR